MRNLVLALVVTPFLLSGCAVIDAATNVWDKLDGKSTATFVTIDSTCRGYALALSVAADFKADMDEDQIEVVEKVRDTVNPICASEDPPANDLATVEKGVTALWGLVAQLDFDNEE